MKQGTNIDECDRCDSSGTCSTCSTCSTCGGDEEDARETGAFQVAVWILGAAAAAVALLVTLPDVYRIPLFVLAYLSFGGRILAKAAKGILGGRFFDENALMAVATIAAFAIGEYPEAIAVAVFYQIGDRLQDRAVRRSRTSIRSLLSLQPDEVSRMRGGEVERVAPESVLPGDLIRVLPGERVPLDGRVVSGESSLDMSALTGESVPRDVAPGEEALAGCVNGRGVLTLEVLRIYKESAVARVLEMVEQSSARKAQTEKFITKFARIYTPAMVGLATAMAILPPLLTGQDFQLWIYRACMLLVISCPCALVLSIPLGYFAGIGAAARRGILVKGGNHLDTLARIGTMAFDKTGTLTQGRLRVVGIEVPEDGPVTPEAFRSIAAGVEAFSGHPVAKAIAEAFKGASEGISDVKEIAGFGLEAQVGGQKVLCGGIHLLRARNVTGLPEADNLPDNGHTAVVMAVDGRYAGKINLLDELRNDAAHAVSDLRSLGISRMVMLTGDGQGAADHAGSRTGMDEVHARLMPEGKVARIETLIHERAGRGSVVFAGDGINDAPVLARADAGIAMGAAGSDAAIESADIVILSDGLGRIADAVRIARKTGRIVRQNIVLSLSIKTAVVLLAALGLGGIWQAVFADVGVALLAVLNSLRVAR